MMNEKQIVFNSSFIVPPSSLGCVVNILRLIDRLAGRESALCRERFVAPCVRGGGVRRSLDGLAYPSRPVPQDFEGWGVFQPLDAATAQVVEAASFSQVAEYLQSLPSMRVRLAGRVRDQTWLAYPVNEDEARCQFDVQGELRVHLVTEGARFEQVIVYSDGCHWLYGELDRRADARIAERLRKLLRQGVYPPYITWKGITPETRAAYALATEFAAEFRHVRGRREADRLKQLEEGRLRDALALDGGALVDYKDEGDNWRVFWQTRDGESHVSIVAKSDLTIVSAGICLSEQDRDFDLQSLVGVVEGAWDY